MTTREIVMDGKVYRVSVNDGEGAVTYIAPDNTVYIYIRKQNGAESTSAFRFLNPQEDIDAVIPCEFDQEMGLFKYALNLLIIGDRLEFENYNN